MIRLACTECDRSDKDGIDEEQLEACLLEGWTDITFIQAYEQSLQTYEPGEGPPGFDAMEWWTHLGTCPDCNRSTDR